MQTSCPFRCYKRKRSYAFSRLIEGCCQVPLLSLIVLILAMLPEAFASEYTSHLQSGIPAFQTGEYLSRMMKEQTTWEGKETGRSMLLCQEGGGSGLPQDLRLFMAYRRLDAMYEFYYYARKNKKLPDAALNTFRDELEKIPKTTYVTKMGYRYIIWGTNLPAIQAKIRLCAKIGGTDWAKFFTFWQRRRIKLVNQRITILNTVIHSLDKDGKKAKYDENIINNYRTWAPEAVGVVSDRNVDYLELNVCGWEDNAKDRYPGFLEEYRRGVYGNN
ncbi:MAG: hypothetical protein IJS08_19630 [Victivallales bacterium]|nr:hypothetical protein [Victivallales bacterium]